MDSVGPFRLQALDGRRVDDETGYRVVLFQHLTGQKIANQLKVTGYWLLVKKNGPNVATKPNQQSAKRAL